MAYSWLASGGVTLRTRNTCSHRAGTGGGVGSLSWEHVGRLGGWEKKPKNPCLAEGSLSQHLEQLELGGVGLLRALLDHVGDVDLLDVSIFLQKTGRRN